MQQTYVVARPDRAGQPGVSVGELELPAERLALGESEEVDHPRPRDPDHPRGPPTASAGSYGPCGL